MANDIILLTGFGLFDDLKINPSWEVVKLLKQKHQFPGYAVIIEELTVAYSFIDKVIPDLWRKHRPRLVIHLGVLSSAATGATIDCQSTRTGYIRPDCLGEKHPTGCVVPHGPDVLKTGLDVPKMVEFVCKQTGLNCTVSEDAGKFVCGYTYYTSLNISPSRSLFVHVPRINQPYSLEQSTEILYHAIRFALDTQCLCL